MQEQLTVHHGHSVAVGLFALLVSNSSFHPIRGQKSDNAFHHHTTSHLSQHQYQYQYQYHAI